MPKNKDKLIFDKLIRKVYSSKEDKDFKVRFDYIIDYHYMELEEMRKTDSPCFFTGTKSMIEKVIYVKIEQLCSKFPKKCGKFDIVLNLHDLRNIHRENHLCSFNILFNPHFPITKTMDLSPAIYNDYKLVFKVNKLDSQYATIIVDNHHLDNQIEEFFKTIPDSPY